MAQGEGVPVVEQGGINAAGVGGIVVNNAVRLGREALDQFFQHLAVFDFLQAEEVGACAMVHVRNDPGEVVELGFEADTGPAGGRVVRQKFVVVGVVRIVVGVIEVFDIPVGHVKRIGRRRPGEGQEEKNTEPADENRLPFRGHPPLKSAQGFRCRAGPARGGGPWPRDRTGARGFRGGRRRP